MSTLVEELTEIDRQLDTPGAPVTASAVHAISGQLRESSDAQQLDAAAPIALRLCQRFYADGRSIDILPLALSLHQRSKTTPNGETPFRAATACGLLFTDSGDFATSLDYRPLHQFVDSLSYSRNLL